MVAISRALHACFGWHKRPNRLGTHGTIGGQNRYADRKSCQNKYIEFSMLLRNPCPRTASRPHQAEIILLKQVDKMKKPGATRASAPFRPLIFHGAVDGSLISAFGGQHQAVSYIHKKLTAVLYGSPLSKTARSSIRPRASTSTFGRAAREGGPSLFQPMVQLSGRLIRTAGGRFPYYAASVSFCSSAMVSTNAKCKADALDSPPF